MRPKDADGMANSVDPDQNCSLEAVQTLKLSENLGSLQFFTYSVQDQGEPHHAKMCLRWFSTR